MNNAKHTAVALTAAFGLAGALAAAPAVAQEGYERQAQPAPQANVSGEKLDQFVTALTDVHDIRNKTSAELEQSSDMEEAQQIQQRAQAEMLKAVEDAGLTVDEYNRIAALMGSDPEINARISSRLEERS